MATNERKETEIKDLESKKVDATESADVKGGYLKQTITKLSADSLK